jgi:hypothetical protein
MNYWLTGTGLEHISAELVAADQRGTDDRRAHKLARRRSGQARQTIANALITLATRLAPAEAPAPGAATPATSMSRP